VRLLASPAETPSDFGQSAEEWLDEAKQFLTGFCQSEWTPLKEGHSQFLLEAQHLRANRGLLNAVGHLPRCGAHSPMPGHIVQELEMMDVHGKGWPLSA
jgi:hypothetical protein